MAKNNTTDAEKVANIFQKYSNPLRALNSREIERLLSNANYGDDIRLQIAFTEIEKNSPIFSICINKRLSGVISRKWDVTPLDDSPEAKKQAAYIKEMLLKCDTKNQDGLTEALQHLAMSTFRGRAAIKPFIDDNGELMLKKLDNWNFIRYLNKNYWNPKSNATFLLGSDSSLELSNLGLKEIPDGEIAFIEDKKPLDWAGISIYLRLLIGEEQYARSMEKFGLPQVLLKAPEGTPDTDLDRFNYRAQAIYEGASGTLPFGTGVDILTAARGQDPFSQFITHQMEMFTILATGSTLATLGGTSGATGGGMGSDVAATQQTQFDQLVSLDCKRIQNAMQPVIDACAYSRNTIAKCRFQFIEDEHVNVNEYLDYASKLQSLGVTIDIQKLKTLTKLDFIKDEQQDIWKPKSEEQI